MVKYLLDPFPCYQLPLTAFGSPTDTSGWGPFPSFTHHWAIPHSGKCSDFIQLKPPHSLFHTLICCKVVLQKPEGSFLQRLGTNKHDLLCNQYTGQIILYFHYSLSSPSHFLFFEDMRPWCPADQTLQGTLILVLFSDASKWKTSQEGKKPSDCLVYLFPWQYAINWKIHELHTSVVTT